MNYRHHFHAGNFADVCKHVVLGRLVEAMARKEKGFLYLDTHAGRGRYDLSVAAQGDSLARAPEWPDGIGRILARGDAPPAVRTYVDRVRAFDRQSGHLGEGLRFYPGSPWLVKAALRPQDRMVLCELHPAEKAALAAEFHRVPRVSVLELDGYTAVRAQLPCPERRALVLLDPPFESPDEWRQLVDALAVGLERMPGATFAIWYPLTQRARVEAFLAELERRPLPLRCFLASRTSGGSANFVSSGPMLGASREPCVASTQRVALASSINSTKQTLQIGLPIGSGIDWLLPRE